jgi:hypothetical protein
MFDFFSGAGAPTQPQGGLMGLYGQQMPSGLGSYGYSSPMDSSMFMQRALGPMQQSIVQPQGYRDGGSVARGDLAALPGYQAGGSIGFSPVSRALPSERKFIDERLGEYEAYNREVEPYNQALEDYKNRFGEYQSAYDRYVADVEAYNRAAETYNAGDRYEDFTMAQPSFGMQAPEFTKQAPVMPNFTPEQLQQYQQQARQRAAQRASSLGSAFDMGIAPEVAQYFRKGIA